MLFYMLFTHSFIVPGIQKTLKYLLNERILNSSLPIYTPLALESSERQNQKGIECQGWHRLSGVSSARVFILCSMDLMIFSCSLFNQSRNSSIGFIYQGSSQYFVWGRIFLTLKKLKVELFLLSSVLILFCGITDLQYSVSFSCRAQ